MNAATGLPMPVLMQALVLGFGRESRWSSKGGVGWLGWDGMSFCLLRYGLAVGLWWGEAAVALWVLLLAPSPLPALSTAVWE